jgi:hypothetical protein
VLATLERPMSKAARRGEGSPKKTKWVLKVNDDLGEMISWIVQLRGGTVATYIDPLIRKQVEKDYETIATSW